MLSPVLEHLSGLAEILHPLSLRPLRKNGLCPRCRCRMKKNQEDIQPPPPPPDPPPPKAEETKRRRVTEWDALGVKPMMETDNLQESSNVDLAGGGGGVLSARPTLRGWGWVRGSQAILGGFRWPSVHNFIFS